ncbi:quinon protein alcohol dehydrogenase-like superfamily [Zopfochytrium polystomum]|nr:quinon protein alcohol dehydrogenase-like superfamily [Zopfochytrium polystomum]
MSMIASHYLTSQDDSIQSIAVHPKEKTIVAGANSPDDDIARGSNLNCRFFTLTKDNRLLPQKAVSTLEGVNGQYQRVARYSPDGQLLATGGTDGKLHILQSSDCTEAVPHLELGGEAYDAHFDPLSTTIVAVSSKKCFVVNVKQGRTLWFTEKPIISGLPGDFRASRFGTGLTQGSIYLVVNAHSRKKAFVCKWNTSTWKMERFRAVAEKPVTAFTISDDGSLLGVGASDASVSILDAKSLTLLQRFPNAHGFPITSLSFSPSSRVLVSGSADGTCHVAKVAPKGRGMSLFSLFLLALLLVLLLVSVALYLIGLPSDDGEL